MINEFHINGEKEVLDLMSYYKKEYSKYIRDKRKYSISKIFKLSQNPR